MVCQKGFANASRQQGAVGYKWKTKTLLQGRQDSVCHHTFHLVGNTGHGYEYLTILFEPHTGGGPSFIRDHRTDIRDLSLFEITLYHGSLQHPFKNVLYIG